MAEPTCDRSPGSPWWNEMMLRRGLFPLQGGGILGGGWPRFEQDERELGVKPALALDDEQMDPMCWVLDLMICADEWGMTPEQVLGA